MSATTQFHNPSQVQTPRIEGATNARVGFDASPNQAALYMRRRLAVGAALIIVGAMLWTLATWATASSVGVSPAGADRTASSEQTYIVQPGDTLWTIATQFDTEGDVRDTVDRLAERNGGSALSVGQRLRVG